MSSTGLHINTTETPSEQHIQYLRNLPPHQKQRVLAALAGPEQQAKSTLLNFDIDYPGLLLTRQQLDAAVEDCYKSICLNKMEETYAIAIEAVEQLVFLAARMVKGEGCQHHPEYESPCKGSGGIHPFFEYALENLQMALDDEGSSWSYSSKAKFALLKLKSIHPGVYGFLKAGGVKSSMSRDLWEQYEEMWGHDHEECPGCGCWDAGNLSSEGHIKGCSLYPLQDADFGDLSFLLK